MRIRTIQADISHAAIIATMGKKSFHNTYGHLFDSKEELFEYLEQVYDPIKLANSLRKENNIYFLAIADDQPVGFVKVKKSSLSEHIESIAQMQLQKIYVLPEFQSGGVGLALLKEVRSLCRREDPDYLWLDTYVGNEKAIGFYERNGFKKAGRHFFTIGSQSFEYYVMSLAIGCGARVTNSTTAF